MSLIDVYVYNSDGHCSRPNDTIGPPELSRSDYQQQVEEICQDWHRMKCGDETPRYIDSDCCISWCEQLTSFFSQASSWKDHCFKMWRCRKNEKARMKFSMILTNTTDSSCLGRIKVKQCWKLNFPTIKLTPSSEVGVFDFLVTFLMPIVVGPLIPPFRECQTYPPPDPGPRSYRYKFDFHADHAKLEM